MIQPTLITNRTNPEQIAQAMAECPEGPIVLWHFTAPNDPKHRARKARLTLTCEKVGENLYMFNGAQWRLRAESFPNGSGFALLERVIERKTPQPVKRTGNRPDPREWWLAGLKRKGWLVEGEKQPPAQPAPLPDFGIGLSPDE